MALGLAVCIIASAFWGFAYGGCNQKHAAKLNEVAYITSPGYPGNFTEYVDCYYDLYSTSENPGLLVYVDVVDVTLRCDDETTHLHVYDGFSRRPRFLGRICEGGQKTFQSPKQTLYLVFRSRTQHAGRSRGFRLRVRTVPEYCHCFTQKTAVLDAGSTPAVLTSPYYPYGTEPNVNCRWLLKAPEDSRVNATLLHTDMKGSSHCHHFGLYVYDGKTTYDDKLLASVCENSAQSFQSSGPYLLIVFSSGSMVYRSGGGVKLQYSATPADVSGRQLIGQTLFFVITALLILLILVITFLAVIKLFLLPRRREQAERRRRASRARLTRVNRHGSSQSDSASRSESGRHHASCSRASSSVSGSSVSSYLSGMPLTRLLSLYGLKKCRQEHRCGSSRRTSTVTPSCHYNAQRSGIIIRVPDFSMYEAHGVLSGELPPSYEEAIRQQVIGLDVTGREVSVQLIAEQDATERGQEQRTLLAEPIRQEVEWQRVAEQEVTGQGVTGQGVVEQEVRGEEGRQRTLSEEAIGEESVAEALERAVVAEVMRQTAQEDVSGQPSTYALDQATNDEVTADTLLLRGVTEQMPDTEPSEQSSQGQVVEPAHQEQDVFRESAEHRLSGQSAECRVSRKSAERRMSRESAERRVSRESAERRVSRESAERRVSRESAECRLSRESAERRGVQRVSERRVSRESAERRVSRESAERRVSRESAERRVSRESAELGEVERTTELDHLKAGGEHTTADEEIKQRATSRPKLHEELSVSSPSASPCQTSVTSRQRSTQSHRHRPDLMSARSAEQERQAESGSATDDDLIRAELV